MLNVGFGLGLVDSAIQAQNPGSHTIIEAHPDVLRKVCIAMMLNTNVCVCQRVLFPFHSQTLN